ncbi:MAG: NAD(P)H-dependent oxidoreductase subunit E [Thiolinea sp.]
MGKKASFKKRGRSLNGQVLSEIEAWLAESGLPLRRDLLIEYLHIVQDRKHCLPADYLNAIAHKLHISLVEVYEVASFYHHFDPVKEGDAVPPALTVRVCDSISCQQSGAESLIADLSARLADKGGELRIQRVPCVGRCEAAPVAVVGQHPVEQATTDKVSAAVDNGQQDATIPEQAKDLQTYLDEGGYQLYQQCLSDERDDESVLSELENSGLRGLGGAGFPVGRKWRIVKGQTAPRLMAVNIDEGEPGTFKDRYYLERDPHRFFEGMLIAAKVVGTEAIYIYLRDEYHGVKLLLERELAALKQHFPELPPIELRRGAGAYVCGEESAMVESIEGKRGMPRLRPPYLAEVGLFGRPTLEHNMESLYWVRDILDKGAAEFTAHGRNGRKGLRSFSVSGRVNKPGVHLAPAGITMRELIDEYCGGMLEGHTFYGYLPGGASGGILPASKGDLPLDFDTLNEHGCFIGSAAVIVLSDQDKARDVALNAMRFFEHESCGQCTPCRVGTAKAVKLMEQPVWDQALMKELSTVMIDASICGLGQAAPNPLQCVINYFPQEVK